MQYSLHAFTSCAVESIGHLGGENTGTNDGCDTYTCRSVRTHVAVTPPSARLLTQSDEGATSAQEAILAALARCEVPPMLHAALSTDLNN